MSAKQKPPEEPEQLPPDPEFEGTPVGHSLEGMHDMAVILGAFRRELVAEGFPKAEAYKLCETWLVNTFDDLDAEEEDED